MKNTVENVIYTKVQSGEIAGSATAAVLPTIACSMVWFKAVASNAGKVYLGVAGVTVVNGTADATSGIELAAGDMIGPIPITNLNLLYLICDNAGDDLTYFAVG